ncbi:MAG: LacI family DNA-binding transcriptional regulator [Ignavibacteriales bacterium]|nr:LacI family DNA-binding transcriptional regulator [Ignavibacteriales bacterium]
MSYTIKNVAEKAGVSTATVSLVVHNNKRISPDTRKKVLRVIKQLNYYPSRSARGLVTQKTGNIGFILTEDHFLKTEPFYTRIFLGTEFATRETNYYVLLTTVNSVFANDEPLPRFIEEKSVDGIIIAGRVPSALIDRIIQYEIPIVFVDYYPPSGDYPVIMIDNVKGGLLATQHLIDLGHEKIGFIGGDLNHPSISDRLFGYRKALRQSSIGVKDSYISIEEQNTTKQTGYSAAEKLFTKAPDLTAVFACNDAMALGVLQFLKDRNYKVPEEISLIGFDDVESDLLVNPTISTIKVPQIELGMEAMKLIVNVVENNDLSPKKTLIPVELVIRESTRKII